MKKKPPRTFDNGIVFSVVQRCGCRAQICKTNGSPLWTYCDTHSAAPALLKSCKTALGAFKYPSIDTFTIQKELESVISIAEGGK